MILLKFKEIFSKKENYFFILLIFLVLIGAILEMVSISLIPSFVGIMINNDGDYIFNLVNMMDFFIDTKNIDFKNILINGSIFIILIFIIKNTFLTFIIYFEGLVFKKFATRLSIELFNKYINSDYKFHLNNNSSKLISIISNEIEQVRQYTKDLLLVFRESLTLFVIFSILIIAEPLISFLTFFLQGISCLIFYFFLKKSLEKKGKLSQIHRAKQIDLLNQGIFLYRENKILSRENFFLNNFSDETGKKENNQLFTFVVSSLPKIYLEIIAISSFLMITLFFAYLDRDLKLFLPTLALLAVAVIRMIPAFNAITSCLARMSFFKPSLNLLLEQSRQKELTNPKIKINLKFNKQLILNNISYRYSDNSKLILNNIDFKIKKNQAIGIYGKSGSGKTTLLNIIMGLLTPNTGEIYFDDVKLKNNQIPKNIFSIVSQDVVLMDSTVKNNIALGVNKKQINLKKIDEVIKKAQLEELIDNLPKGLDTIIGERGVRLSGGQRQRISIARALYSNPKILILDEATSSLDTKTEDEIMKSIYKLKKDLTIIIVTHRLRSLNFCDEKYSFIDNNLNIVKS